MKKVGVFLVEYDEIDDLVDTIQEMMVGVSKEYSLELDDANGHMKLSTGKEYDYTLGIHLNDVFLAEYNEKFH